MIYPNPNKCAEEIFKTIPAIRTLFEKSKIAGTVAYGLIKSSIAQCDDPEAMLERVIDLFNSHGIEIEHQTGEQEQTEGYWDPVRTYLRTVGSIPLLARDEEIHLAKEIEQSKKDVLCMILKTPIGKKLLRSYLEQVKSQVQPFTFLFQSSDQDELKVAPEEVKREEEEE